MRLRLALALTALLALTAFAPAPFPRRQKAAKDEMSLAGLSGDWKVISLWSYGANRAIANRIDVWKVIRIQDGRWSFCHEANGVVAPKTTYELSVDARNRPARVDFSQMTTKKLWMTGIVRRRDGRLEVLYVTNPTGRPADFDNPPAGCYLFTLIRRK